MSTAEREWEWSESLGPVRQTSLVMWWNQERLCRRSIRIPEWHISGACSWCGERPANGHLYLYGTYSELESWPKWDLPFCSLHCWGQQNGWTDL